MPPSYGFFRPAVLVVMPLHDLLAPVRCHDGGGELDIELPMGSLLNFSSIFCVCTSFQLGLRGASSVKMMTCRS